MIHNNIEEKFEYENNQKFTGKLKEASWLMDKSTWSLCPMIPIKDESINNFTNQLNFSELRHPIDIPALGCDLLGWVNASKTQQIKGIDFLHTTFATGIDNFIDSLILRSDYIGRLSKTYYYVHDLCDHYKKNYYEIDKEIKPNSTVIIEFPTPHHNVEDIKNIIKECIKKQCYIALDFTFLPLCTHDIELDVSEINEIWFSVNKTWPINDIRPAFRFSRNKINDIHDRTQKKEYYNKISANVLSLCIKEFPYDYINDKYKSIANNILKTFDLEPTNNLLLGRKNNIKWDHMPSIYWNYNDLVGLHRLIETQGKYFW